MRFSAQTRSTLAFLPFMLVGAGLVLLLTLTWMLVAAIISVVVIGSVVARRVFNKQARNEVRDEENMLVIENDDPRNIQRFGHNT